MNVSLLKLSQNYWKSNSSFSTVLANYVTQSYVTGLNYITATPGIQLTMNSNNIAFSNNGAGLSWGRNYSRIYDDSNLHITTDEIMYISSPNQLNITSSSSISVETCTLIIIC